MTNYGDQGHQMYGDCVVPQWACGLIMAKDVCSKFRGLVENWLAVYIVIGNVFMLQRKLGVSM